MSDEKKMNLVDYHKYFSAECFNTTWDYINSHDRSKEDDEQMILRAYSSLWHWTQREDCTKNNLSVGYWQLSRVYSILGESSKAIEFAKKCLDTADPSKPFIVGYGYEALARAAMIGGFKDDAEKFKALGIVEAEKVNEKEAKKLLLDDLNQIGV
jgi:tetratricopeptide (TPR) repeat protein